MIKKYNYSLKQGCNLTIKKIFFLGRRPPFGIFFLFIKFFFCVFFLKNYWLFKIIIGKKITFQLNSKFNLSINLINIKNLIMDSLEK